MATKNLTLYSSYRVGTGGWGATWTPPLTDSNDNGDNNRFYLGGEKKYHTKFKVTIDSNLVISSTNSLILKLTGDEAVYPKYMRAYLSTENHDSTVGDSTIMSKSVEMSYLWLDTSKTKRATSSQSTPVPMYAIFNYQLKAGSSYYIYLLPFTSDSATSPTYEGTWLRAKNQASSCNVTLDYESYSRVGAPGTPTLNKTQIFKDGAVIISWKAAENGTNNKVVKYRIYYQLNSYPTDNTTTFLDTTSTSLTIRNSNIGNYPKGSKIYFSIQTIGELANFHSSLVQVGICSIVNKSPTYPTFSIEGVILTSQESTEVTIKNIVASDVDNDSLTYYYKVSELSALNDPTGAKLVKNNDKIIVTPTQRYVYVWAYDGTTFGDSARKTVEINTPPVINSISAAGENILNNSGQPCTRYLSTSADLSKAVEKYEWYIWNSAALSYSLLGTTPELTNVSIEQYYYDRGLGEKIAIKLIVTDSNGERAERDYITNFYQMPGIKAPLSLQIFRDELANGTVNESFINTKIKAILTLPASEETDIPLKSVSIQSVANGESKVIYSTGISSNGANEFLIEDDFEYGKQYSFSAEIVDNANRTAKVETNKQFSRLPLINLSPGAGVASELVPRAWHVLRNEELAISTAFIDDENIGKTTYQIYVSINNGAYRFLTEFDANSSQTEINGSTIIYRDSSSFELFKKLGLSTNKPDYKADYRIIGLNAFGEVGDEAYYGLIQNRSIITKEAPYFSEAASFFARVGYIEDPNKIASAILKDIPTTDSEESIRMFNSGELIDFCLTELALDLNSTYYDGKEQHQIESIPYYEVEYALSDLITQNLSSLSWKKLGALNTNNWIKEAEYYHQGIIAPNLSATKTYIYFRVFATDDTKMRSNILYFSQPLICCRKKNPIIKLKKVEVDFVDSIYTGKISFLVEDYGGNNLGYENFFRDGTEKVSIRVRYGTSIETMSKQYEKETLINELPDQLTFALDQVSSGKIYFQLSIHINTNSFNNEYNQVSSALPVYVYYSEGPTVSHRAHWVGVNNTVFASDEILRAEAFRKGSTDRHVLRFIGFDAQNNVETTIELDLNSRVMAGVVINGGNWDGIPEEPGYVILEGEEGAILYALEEG